MHSSQIGVKIDFFTVCRLGISISKDWKSHALGQKKCSMVRPLYSKYFINNSEPQNKLKQTTFSESEIEQGTFTPLVFTTTGGMADECLRWSLKISRANFICKKARELRHNNFMGQGESVICNFAECTPMPKGIENPEKEELRY